MINRLIPFMPQIAAGLLAVVAAMALAIGLLLSANGSCRQANGELKMSVRGFQEAKIIQDQSISDLNSAILAKNAETDARNAALAKQLEDDAKSRAQSDLRAATTQKRLDALNRIAANGTSVCGVSDELRAALKGL